MLIHIHALCTACYMVMECEMGFDELMWILFEKLIYNYYVTELNFVIMKI
jgi:hypothetical protein